MHYTTELQIDLPLDRVVSLFDDPDTRTEWQPNLQHIELVEGKSRQAGAVSKLRFVFEHSSLDMLERILLRELPERIDAAYDTGDVLNLQSHRFEAVDFNSTLWRCYNEFQFSGPLAESMQQMPDESFAEQTKSFMQAFKEFAETR